MAGSKVRRGGKKNRKHGRWSRSPSMKRYVAENRLEKNKRRRAERHRKRMAEQRKKVEERKPRDERSASRTPFREMVVKDTRAEEAPATARPETPAGGASDG